MNRKLIIACILCLLLTGAILFGGVVYISNMVLPSGSAEEFAAVKGWDNSILYREQEKDFIGGDENAALSNILFHREEGSLYEQLGGVQWIEDGMDQYVLYYVLEPTQQLRDEIQQDPEFRYTEVALAKCDYTLKQLGEALDALDVYLASVPVSVRNSVQASLISPRENRVAIYVKNWSVFDQLSLAKAMGTMCLRLYVVEENLDKAMPQMQFFHYDNWHESEVRGKLVVPEFGGTAEPLPKEIAYEAGKRMRSILEEYMWCMQLINPQAWLTDRSWRTVGMLGGAGYNAMYACLQAWSWKQMPIYGDPYSRPSHSETVAYVFYEEWGVLQERMTKAIFHEMADFEYPIVVVHSY